VGNGVIMNGVKVAHMDDRLIPRAVVLDPEVTVHTPQRLWTSSGVKAVDHAAEAIWTQRSHAFADALSAAALKMMFDALPRTVTSPDDLSAPLDCQLAAWMCISTIRNTGERMSHAFDHNLGAVLGMDHGITSCIVLPPVMKHLASGT
jgi:alcohol dehydrogenase class IV